MGLPSSNSSPMRVSNSAIPISLPLSTSERPPHPSSPKRLSISARPFSSVMTHSHLFRHDWAAERHVFHCVVVRVLADPLRDVPAVLGNELKAGVKLVGHHALVRPVVVAD